MALAVKDGRDAIEKCAKWDDDSKLALFDRMQQQRKLMKPCLTSMIPRLQRAARILVPTIKTSLAVLTVRGGGLKKRLTLYSRYSSIPYYTGVVVDKI